MQGFALFTVRTKHNISTADQSVVLYQIYYLAFKATLPTIIPSAARLQRVVKGCADH